jgi:hypothetical protein
MEFAQQHRWRFASVDEGGFRNIDLGNGEFPRRRFDAFSVIGVARFEQSEVRDGRLAVIDAIVAAAVGHQQTEHADMKRGR